MLYTAFIIGLAGSFHCIGMCSPLAIAVTHSSSKIILNRLLYNLGRILTYGMLGALIASIGFALPLSGYQNLLSLALGVTLIVWGFIHSIRIRIGFISSSLSRVTFILKKYFSVFLRKKNYGSLFLMGVINGLLPCGLSFLALTYCVILPSPQEGFLFMLVFGMGTLPAMLGFAAIFRWVATRFQLNSSSVVNAFVILSGCLLIVRVFLIHLPHAASFSEALVNIATCR
ncbi:MAG: sulfite exporter TauE/SafE family protein [Bacteroidetes bacterium]|nr:sulfite exporter TauE/SafE family protein [Bacteroidota bacterium]